MKKSRKAILATAVFYAATNFNGCVYGPPADDMNDSDLAKDIPAVEQLAENVDETGETAHEEV